MTSWLCTACHYPSYAIDLRGFDLEFTLLVLGSFRLKTYPWRLTTASLIGFTSGLLRKKTSCHIFMKQVCKPTSNSRGTSGRWLSFDLYNKGVKIFAYLRIWALHFYKDRTGLNLFRLVLCKPVCKKHPCVITQVGLVRSRHRTHLWTTAGAHVKLWGVNHTGIILDYLNSIMG